MPRAKTVAGQELTRESLSALLEDLQGALDANRAQVVETQAKLDELRAEQADLTQQAAVIASTLSRKYPDAKVPEIRVDTGAAIEPSVFASLSRIDAVEAAVISLSGSVGMASPESIVEVFRRYGRPENRDSIGAALSTLRNQGRVTRLSRGRWVAFESRFKRE